LTGLGRWRCNRRASLRSQLAQLPLQIADAIHDSGHLFAQISRERIRPHDRNDRQDDRRGQHRENYKDGESHRLKLPEL
jgi:hypothetical protein